MRFCGTPTADRYRSPLTAPRLYQGTPVPVGGDMALIRPNSEVYPAPFNRIADGRPTTLRFGQTQGTAMGREARRAYGKHLPPLRVLC